MVVRSSAAICGAAIIFVHLSVLITKAGIDTMSPYAAEKVVKGDRKQFDPEKRSALAAGAAIVGAASTYNPYRSGSQEGGTETASGERHDPGAWTAAIRTDLREKFGGVRFGKGYRPAFALVQSADKQAIVKINDVGPLKPGRVIDLNEQTMRYFDPTLRHGLIREVKVTPLLGDDWSPGPIEEDG